MNIREMTWDDLEQVVAIENDNFSVPWTETGFFTYLMREDALFLVAEEAEEILGYCGVIMAMDEGDITNVSVKKTIQGKGVGTALLKELIRQTADKGVLTLFLEVRESNQPALALYEKQGFVRMGVRKNYYTDPVEDGITMSRKDSL